MDKINIKRLELLEETAAFFNLINRGTKDTGIGCYYFVEGKEGCAIGRKIKDKELCKQLNEIGGVVKAFEHLPADLKELGMDFLYDLQRLHDVAYHWDDQGLTELGNELGKKVYETIKANINIGTYEV